MKIRILLLLLIGFVAQLSQAQVSFTNRNDRLTESDFHSGVAIGIADMNGDNKDDIIRMNQGYELHIEYQNGPNEMFTTKSFGNMGGNSRWSMCIADIDNNGFNEFLVSGSYDDIRLSTANDSGTDFSLSMLPNGSSIFVQGSNFVDIDNDGFVDIFACHDDGESKVWGNNGTGNFVERDIWIDMSVDGSSGEVASGNYGSIWADIDSDGDVDLYIAKCRLGTTDLTDTRRLNTLWINDGNGNFTEEGEARGLRVGYQSWTSDFQDVNNDGRPDLFIAKGNVMDLAVGLIIGAAFTAIVKSMVSDLINPLIGLFFGGVDFVNLFIVLKGEAEFVSLTAARDAGASVFAYGAFLMAVVNFMIIAFVVFMLVRYINRIKDASQRQEEKQVEVAPAGPTELSVLTEIRDALAKS